MKHEKFSIRIPAELVAALDVEAGKRFRNRNQLIIDIFTERYHSPPLNSHSQSISSSRALPGVNRKRSKAAIG